VVDEITLREMKRNIQKAKEANELIKGKKNTKTEDNGAHPKSIREEESRSGHVNYNILAHLKRIPALLSVYDALQMSPELRKALITALTDPEPFKGKIEAPGGKVSSYEICASCMACISFGDDDRQLGEENHNRPLYVTGTIFDTEINRIMLDGGSAVNVLPLKSLRAVGLQPRHLSPSLLTIQGFNQAGERALGSITLKVEIGELSSNVLFHVIDSNTSYNVLLGRPWLHGCGVIPSTLHQCFKFCKDGEVMKVNADLNPFRGEQVNYADAKFYKSADVTILKDAIKTSKGEKMNGTTKQVKSSSKPNQRMTFKYVPKSQRAPGQKALASVKNVVETLMTSFTFPLRKLDQTFPVGKMQISITFGECGSSNKRVVTVNSNKPRTFPNPTSRKSKAKGKKVFFKKQQGKVVINQNDSCLKAIFEPEVFTEREQDIFSEENTRNTTPRVSVFERIEYPSVSRSN